MNEKLKRWTAAGLVAIMLLVGFIAEYTHRHVTPSAGQTAIAHAGCPQPGKSAGPLISHDCFICQLTSVTVEIAPVIDLAILNFQAEFVAVETVVCLGSNHFAFAFHRGPPAFLA